MKILAATPDRYNGAVYIAELSNYDLSAILALSPHGIIAAVSLDGAQVSRSPHECKAGDVISRETIDAASQEILALRTDLEIILKAFAQSKGSMTKVENILKKTLPVR